MRSATSDNERLSLRPREAAKRLGIGERSLWKLTSEGKVPHLRLGRAVLYPVAALEAWLAEQAAESVKGEAAHD